MCKRSVNAISRLYDFVSLGDCSIGESLYQNQFDTIKVLKDENGTPYIGNFSIVSDINLLGTSKDSERSTNYIESNTVAKFKIRLTKISEDANRQYSWDLDHFEIEPSSLKQKACVDFLNFTKVTHINRILLKADDYIGRYVIKILLQDDNEKWIVQSISNLFVEC